MSTQEWKYKNIAYGVLEGVQHGGAVTAGGCIDVKEEAGEVHREVSEPCPRASMPC